MVTTTLAPAGTSVTFPIVTRWLTPRPPVSPGLHPTQHSYCTILTRGFIVLEVEVRYRTDDRPGVIAKLLAWGATLTQDRTDVDLYFDAPDRSLKTTDEAFRLRRIGAANMLTYKGPRRDTETRTRTEIEIPLGDGDATATDTERLLVALGYKPIVVVRKKRLVYAFLRGEFNMEVCFDDLEGVGPFVELEILSGETHYEAAKAVLLTTAAELGLTEKETRSYIGMVLASQGRME